MKASNDPLTKILGYEPNKVLRLKILQEVQQTKQSIQEVAKQYQMPEILELKDGMLQTSEGPMTPEQFEKKNPYVKLVTFQEHEY